jgi:hypothetical protein
MLVFCLNQQLDRLAQAKQRPCCTASTGAPREESWYGGRPARSRPRRQVPVPPGGLLLKGLDVLERGDDVVHGGAALGVAREALAGEPCGPERGLGVVLAVDPLVHEGLELAAGAGEVGPRPLHQVVLVAGAVQVVRAQPRQQLQQHHAEAVHVALHVQVPCMHVVVNDSRVRERDDERAWCGGRAPLPYVVVLVQAASLRTGGDVLRRRVAVGADDPGRDVRLPGGGPVLGEPEVRQLGSEILRWPLNMKTCLCMLCLLATLYLICRR